MTHAEGGHVRAAHQASRRSFAGVSCSLCALLDDFILTVFSFPRCFLLRKGVQSNQEKRRIKMKKT